MSEKDIDLGAPESPSEKTLDTHVKFLSDTLTKTVNQTQGLDNQSNIVLGIASAMFVYSTAQIGSRQSVVFVILSIFSAITVITCLLGIHPPKSLRMKNKIESVKSLMSNKRITSYHSSEQYSDRLIAVMGDARRITDHYAAAIFNMNVNYYRPKRNMFKISVKILITGIAIAALITAYQHGVVIAFNILNK